MRHSALVLFVTGSKSSELFQKPLVIFEQDANVVYSVAKHCDSINAHAEGIARVFLRIYIDRFQYIRIDHAASKYLKPPASSVQAWILLDEARPGHERLILSPVPTSE